MRLCESENANGYRYFAAADNQNSMEMNRNEMEIIYKINAKICLQWAECGEQNKTQNNDKKRQMNSDTNETANECEV